MTPAELGLSVKRLQVRGLLRFTAITDTRQHGAQLMAFLRIRADTADLQGLAAKVASFDEIHSVAITLGRSNLLAVALVVGAEAVGRLLHLILEMPGVTEVTTTSVIRSIKYNERMASLSNDRPA